MGVGTAGARVMSRVFPTALVLALLLFCALQSGAASPAGVTGISDTIFRLQAINASGRGSFSVSSAAGQWDAAHETFTWSLPAPIDIHDDVTGNWLATLLNADVSLGTSQLYEIDVGIGVVSGTSETTFAVGSPLLSFPTILDQMAEGRATASFTVTDLESDGACLVGLGTYGTGAFRSYYNGYLADGTRFTHLIGLICVDNGGTANGWQTDPTFGFRPIGEAVSDISTEIAFTLTADDIAFATTTTDVPEPPECFGDINGDGVIDLADLSELLAAYGTMTGEHAYNADADLNEDGLVDLVDLTELLTVFGETCP